MAKRKEILTDFYSNHCDEEIRLIKNKQHTIEFLTTIRYIDKYLKSGDKILEIGAGTGRYSLHYASKGYEVNAIEYVQHNLDVLNSKIKKDYKIKAEQGDAIDLSRFDDNTFDMTLCFGPLYHLYNDDDINKAISEAVRVTKPNGIIMFAFLTSDSIMIDWALSDHHLIDGYGKDFDENFKMNRAEEYVFTAFYIKEFKEMMEKYNIKYITSVATDGISNHVEDRINDLNDEEFEMWLKYHYSICEREDLQGFSNHIFYIFKKK